MYYLMAYAFIVTLLIIILGVQFKKEHMIDDQTFTLLMDLPYSQPVRIRGMNPNEYIGYGYLTPQAGPMAAMGNTLRILGQEFTNPRQGMSTDNIELNKYLNYVSDK